MVSASVSAVSGQTASSHAEILICGAGIIGLTVARELLRRGYRDLLVVEKEAAYGLHASGRNSGVLHSGIYYSEDSEKARYCLQGNLLMQEYCREQGLPLLAAGKVVVAASEAELPALQQLYRRGSENGAAVELINERQLADIEPLAKTFGQALYSPQTCVVDPKAIVGRLVEELTANGVRFQRGVEVLGLVNGGTVKTNRGAIGFGRFINCAGAYSDRIAHLFGRGRNYRLIPFKGVYRQIKPEADYHLNCCIYPVPNLENPFLGVHFTKAVDATVYLGPTATPAFGRENYRLFQGLDRESASIAVKDLSLFFHNENFRHIARSEIMKYFAGIFIKDAARLVQRLDPRDIIPSMKVGIRPQLIDVEKDDLVMDFVVERGERDIHVLNAISPAFTSSMAFATKIANFATQ